MTELELYLNKDIEEEEEWEERKGRRGRGREEGKIEKRGKKANFREDRLEAVAS